MTTLTTNLQVIDPFSGDVVVERAFDDGAVLEQKLAAAATAFERWRRVPLDARCRAVSDALAWFRAHKEEVAADVSRQMGKPIRQARAEVDGMLGRAEHMVSIAGEALAAEVLASGADGAVRRIEHAPLGVVLDVAAWNYPLLIAVNVVVPALLAGNAVLLKHSAKTPLCGEHFVRAFQGLGAGLVQSLVLDHPTTAKVVQDPRVAHVAFTGSVAGGRAVHQQVAGRFIDVGLELGGKDPAYVAADADLERSVAGVVDGACYNAGQSCCAVERVYVHAARYAEFLARARAELAAYALGDPMAEATTMGPLVSEAARDVVAAQVADAVARGARVLIGGTAPAGRAPFFQPTLLADCPPDSLAMREETFGPLLPVWPVADDDEALVLMNDSRYGLTASVWTSDRARAERFAAALDCGTVYQNRCDYLDPALPWTGVKDSGRGSTLSRWGFAHLTRRKAVYLRVSPG